MDTKLTTGLLKVPRPRILELYPHSLTCLHGIVLNFTVKYRDKFTPPFLFTSIRIASVLSEI
jgi:hypothetical protein